MFGGFDFGRLNPVPLRFDEQYRCYPVSFCDKSHLEDGDKILLPPSALEMLARMDIAYPMLFQLENESMGRKTHCGVLEFSAQEGSCYMPYWMMQNMFISEGSILRIKNVTLPKASFVKIRPQSIDFLDITNPRAVLEASLRKFSCMTVGDTICLSYNSKKFLLDVRQVKPADAACIIETDCEVDFETPADYIPPPPPPPLPYGGVPTVSSGSTLPPRPVGMSMNSGLRLQKGPSNADAVRAARMKKYEPFHGTGQSVNGSTANTKVEPSSASNTSKEVVEGCGDFL